jgi:hypothetical protein
LSLNISTIIGVSVATFVAGPFLSKFADKEFIISDFIISVIFYFLCVWLLLAVIYSTLKEMFQFAKNKKHAKSAGDGLLLLFVIWIAVVSFPYAKYFVGNAFNVSYLLAQPALKAIKDIGDVKQEKTDDILTISGKVFLGESVKGSDYELLVYSKSGNGIYDPVRLTSNEYVFELSNSGFFVLPINTKYNSLSDVHLVVFRSSDWSVIDGSGMGSGFPDSMTFIPNKSIEDLSAFVYRVGT